jgi:hypothetical protein
MNARISRFLRKFATTAGKDYRKVKKVWTSLPLNRRAGMKAALAKEIE